MLVCDTSTNTGDCNRIIYRLLNDTLTALLLYRYSNTESENKMFSARWIHQT